MNLKFQVIEYTVLENSSRTSFCVRLPLSRRDVMILFCFTFIGPIGDTKLLNLARKLGAEWPSIAKMLQLEEEEVDELREITDSTMAAFRMLWSWRDQNSSKREEDLVNELIVVLRRSGRTELSQIFIKESSA